MEANRLSDFINLLSSFSSEIAFKILSLYSNNQKSYTLTETAREINEKTSTVKDHLIKLVNATILYKTDKTYNLSNFGSFIINYVKNMEILNRLKMIFGELPAELIPSEFIHEVLPYIEDITVQIDVMKLANISNRILKQIDHDLGKKKVVINMLGWKSLALSEDIIQDFFKGVSLDRDDSIEEFLTNTNFKLIAGKKMLEELNHNPKYRKRLENPDINKNFFIYEEIDTFKFTFFKFNDKIQFFFNEQNKMRHFLVENNPKAIDFFDKVFNYYFNKSIPLADLINKSK